MLQVGLGLIERGERELLRHCTVTKSSDLRKDEPDPVTRFSSGAKFSADDVISGCLGGEEAVEVVSVGHSLFPRSRLPLCRHAMLKCSVCGSQ